MQSRLKKWKIFSLCLQFIRPGPTKKYTGLKKMKKKKNVFDLSKDEQKFESEINKGEWRSVPKEQFDQIRDEIVNASNSRSKDARVNLRLNPADVIKIREKAKDEGIPYQTLIASVLHKYATDQFLDGKAVLNVLRKLGKKKIAG